MHTRGQHDLMGPHLHIVLQDLLEGWEQLLLQLGHLRKGQQLLHCRWWQQLHRHKPHTVPGAQRLDNSHTALGMELGNLKSGPLCSTPSQGLAT